MQQENHKLLRAFAMATNAPLEPGFALCFYILGNVTFCGPTPSPWRCTRVIQMRPTPASTLPTNGSHVF